MYGDDCEIKCAGRKQKAGCRSQGGRNMAGIERILVPIDGSKSGERVVEQALYIAKACDAALDFVYVVNLDGVIGGHPLSSSVSFSGSVLEGAVGLGKRILEHALDQTPVDIKARGHCVNGDPGKAILEKADELGADLIIMGSRGLGVLKGALLGSVSRMLVENAKCPVLIVKPDSSVNDR